MLTELLSQRNSNHNKLIWLKLNYTVIQKTTLFNDIIMEFGEAIKNPAYRILQTEYSGCLDISAHA